MMLRRTAIAALVLSAAVGPAFSQQLTIESVRDAEFAPPIDRSGARSPVLLKAQVYLDRARFSPGVIDARFGGNTTQAIAAFERHNDLPVDGRLDEEVWSRLTEGAPRPVLMEYQISQDDVDSDFIEAIPESFAEMAELDRLAYGGPAELIAEKFHMDLDFLRSLNPDVDFGDVGATIIVADTGADDGFADVARIEVAKGEKAVRAYTEDGDLVAFYPATIGSEENPAPDGTYEVRAIAPSPAYYYDPDDLSFEGVDVEGQVKIAPGPNNPVGAVWIDLTAEGYGLHGTPEPAQIGKTYSHGCVRLTNWDALELSRMVEQGTTVAFLEG